MCIRDRSNSVGSTLRFGLGIPEWVSGLAVTALAGLVILGGIGRISQVAQRLMPVSAGIYFIFSVIVILSCAGELPGIFRMIFQEAFQLRSAAGGVGGFVLSRSVRYGLSRGVFSKDVYKRQSWKRAMGLSAWSGSAIPQPAF